MDRLILRYRNRTANVEVQSVPRKNEAIIFKGIVCGISSTVHNFDNSSIFIDLLPISESDGDKLIERW